MAGRLTLKADVKTFIPTWSGARLLGAFKEAGKNIGLDIEITCAADDHPPSDPHSLGEAFDLSTHTYTDLQKVSLLREIMIQLQQGVADSPIEVSGGLATVHFWGWLENPRKPNEHIHVQRRNRTVYTYLDYLNS